MNGHHCHTLFAIITRDNFVRTAGEAGQAAWRIPGGLGGRNRAVRSRRRPGRQGVGRPKWSVRQNRTASPPGRNRGAGGRPSTRIVLRRPPPDGRAFLCPDPAFPAARAPRGLFHHQQVRSLRRHARAAALAVFAVLALALPAAAQSVTTLVSNTGQSTTSAPTGSADRAQAFTTGAAGATLSSVEIISEDNEGDDMAVSLCTVDSSGYPTSSCTALTAPSSFASGTALVHESV